MVFGVSPPTAQAPGAATNLVRPAKTRSAPGPQSFTAAPAKVPRPVPYRTLVERGTLTPKLGADGRAMVEGIGGAPHVEHAALLPEPWWPLTAGEALEGRLRAFTAERFVGVTASQAAAALATQRRFLPLQVWLRLAEVMLTGLLCVPSGVPAPLTRHLLWERFCGPHALCATMDRRLLLSAGPGGYPCLIGADFGDTPLVTHPWAARSGRSVSVGLALQWLLDPWPSNIDATLHAPPTPRHPELTAEVIRPLMYATTIVALQASLRAVWTTTPPASEVDTATFLLNCCPDVLSAEAQAASTGPVPQAWRGGALQVSSDQLLEAAPPVTAVERPPPVTAIVTRLEVRVLFKGSCLFEAQVPTGEPPTTVPFTPLNRLREGTRVTVVLEHAGRRAGLHVEGVTEGEAVRLDPWTDAQAESLRALLQTPAPV